MLDKIRIRNFRCLRDVEVPLSPLTFLVGPNNTGKSSFLDALDLLSRCVHSDSLSSAFAQCGKQFGRVVTGGGDGTQVMYEVDISCAGGPGDVASARYELTFGQGVDALVVESESLTTRSVGANPKVEEGLPRTNARSTFYHLMREEGHERYRRVARAMRCAPKYSLIPERMAAPCQIQPSAELSADGYGLASSLDELREEAPHRFEEIEGALKRFVDTVEMVRFPTAEPGKKTILFHERSTGYKVYASEASQGLLLFLGYLTIAYAHGDVGVLLIEEPEVGVHPNRLRAIVELLRAMSRGALGTRPVQVIATSHSPYLLDWCQSDEVVFFHRDDSGNVRTKPLSDVPDIGDRIEDFESLGAWLYSVGGEACGSHS